MPSIMPLGATTSAPARAWASAWRPSITSVASLSTSTRPPVSARAPQWPWSVYSQKQTSVITSSSGAACLAARTASGMMPASLIASLPRASFCAGMPNKSTPPRPRSAAWRTSSPSRSGESWQWPGMEAISCRNFSPARTNSGSTSCDAERVVWRTSRRTAGFNRSRLMRVIGKRPLGKVMRGSPFSGQRSAVSGQRMRDEG